MLGDLRRRLRVASHGVCVQQIMSGYLSLRAGDVVEISYVGLSGSEFAGWMYGVCCAIGVQGWMPIDWSDVGHMSFLPVACSMPSLVQDEEVERGLGVGAHGCSRVESNDSCRVRRLNSRLDVDSAVWKACEFPSERADSCLSGRCLSVDDNNVACDRILEERAVAARGLLSERVVAGDGHCVFRAVACQTEDGEGGHCVLRLAVSN